NRFRLSFKGNRLEVMCQSEFGSSGMKLDVTALKGTPAGDFWFNLRLLRECLSALSGTLKLGAAVSGALVMQTEHMTCIQMPMREPAPIAIRRPASNSAVQEPDEFGKSKSEKSKAVKTKTARTGKKSASGNPPGTDSNPVTEHKETAVEKAAA
ncbi:MAG: hypothetical protein J6X53_03030, partial [Abditibacteriota bacterium]|nr:hypothetical protein [Abditibacteriota bacterium]